MHYLNQQQRSSWLKRPMGSDRYHGWLADDGSLTLRLRLRYADFSVRLVSVKYAKPLFDEAEPLKTRPYKTALIREVLLMGNGQSVVFAHSVLPRESLRGRWLGLSRLGNRPLGESLFSNPKVKRTVLSFKKLPRHHVLYLHAVQHLPVKPDCLWARRSVFSLGCASMMVTEVFLPQLLMV